MKLFLEKLWNDLYNRDGGYEVHEDDKLIDSM